MPLIAKYERQQSIPGTTGMATVSPSVHITGEEKAFDQAAAHLQAAMDRQQAREDTIQLELAKANFNERMTADALDFGQTEDLRNSNSLSLYNERMAGIKGEVLQNFQGSADARATLEANLIGTQSQFQRQMIGQVKTAQKGFLLQTMETEMQAASKIVYDNPSQILTQIDRVSDRLAELAGGLTYQDEVAQTEAAWNILGTAALDSFIARGDYEGAQNVLETNPAVAGALNQDVYRRYQTQITAARTEELKAQRAMSTKMAMIQTTAAQLGVKVSPAQMFQAVTGVKIASGQSPNKLAVRLRQVAAALGKDPNELPEAVVLSIAGVNADVIKGLTAGDASASLATDKDAIAAQNKEIDGDGVLTAKGIGVKVKTAIGSAVRVDAVESTVLAGIEEWKTTGNNQALIAAQQSFIKMIDDGAVVRDSDIKLMASAQSLMGQAQGLLERWDSGNTVTAAQVDEINRATIAFTGALKKGAWNQIKPYYERQIQSGFDGLTTGMTESVLNDVFEVERRSNPAAPASNAGPAGKQPGPDAPPAADVSAAERANAAKAGQQIPKKRRFHMGLDGTVTEITDESGAEPTREALPPGFNDVPTPPPEPASSTGDILPAAQELLKAIAWEDLTLEEQVHYGSKEDYELFIQ